MHIKRRNEKMIKTIKIGKKSVPLDNNTGWALIYRDQTGQDILPSLLPILSMLMSTFSEIVDEVGGVKEASVDDFIKAIADVDVISKLYSLEFSDFIYLTWSLAKTADASVPDPMTWLKELGEFPLDVIVPEVFSLLLKGLVSSKNLKRLEALKKEIQPKIESTLTQLSLQASKED